VVDLCAAPGSWSQVLSRVLIKGEKFGHAAWQDREAKIRQQMLAVFQKSRDVSVYSASRAERGSQPEERPRREDVKIVAIDLQPISPLPGITTLQADITHPATVPLLLKALDSTYDPAQTSSKQAAHPVDLVLSDGAPDVTGLHDLDIYVQSQLLSAALNLALCVLRPGGNFVAKIFRGKNVDLLYSQMRVFFERVSVAKPRSSRASSVEAFIVCINFQPPAGFQATLERPISLGTHLARTMQQQHSSKPVIARTTMQDPKDGSWSWEPQIGVSAHDEPLELEYEDLTSRDSRKEARWVAPFIACGDLAAFDSDASYTLPAGHVSLEPVQPPTAPPYKRAIELRKAAGGAYGKTAKP
jgi:tRNA (cytidine32/guanosine34-2'-O)-methyltransferase